MKFNMIFLLLLALTFPQTHGQTLEQNSTVIKTKRSSVTLTEEFLQDNVMIRTYSREDKILYKSRVSPLENGLHVETLMGHESQLGSYQVIDNVLVVKKVNGELLWKETLEYPLCPSELAAEFVRAYWKQLINVGDTVQCVIPIIKAEKVAPVKYVRLKDKPNGDRVVELRPDSFGMRFFLKSTKITFNDSGDTWLSQNGQFESTKNPDNWPSYLKGKTTLTKGRFIPLWNKSNFTNNKDS